MAYQTIAPVDFIQQARSGNTDWCCDGSPFPSRSLPPPPRGAEFGFEAFEFGEGELVFAGHYFVRQRVERVAGEGGVGGGAEDDADGRVFAGGASSVRRRS